MTVEIERSPLGHPELDVLLEQARNHIMTPEEREAQRQSWVRGEMAMGDDRQEQWVRGEMTRGLTQQQAEREWRERQADTPLADERFERIERAAASVVKNKSYWLRLVRWAIRFLIRRYGI